MRAAKIYISEKRVSFIYFLKPHVSYLVTNIEMQHFHRAEIVYVSLSKSPDAVHVAKRGCGKINVVEMLYWLCFYINNLWLFHPLCWVTRAGYDSSSAARTILHLQHDAIVFSGTDTTPSPCIRCYRVVMYLPIFRVSRCALFGSTLPSQLAAPLSSLKIARQPLFNSLVQVTQRHHCTDCVWIKNNCLSFDIYLKDGNSSYCPKIWGTTRYKRKLQVLKKF